MSLFHSGWKGIVEVHHAFRCECLGADRGIENFHGHPFVVTTLDQFGGDRSLVANSKAHVGN